MNGPVNFRDLGGYRTSSGATVRWGRVFRSDALLLDDEDLLAFGSLGIRTVHRDNRFGQSTEPTSIRSKSIHANGFAPGRVVITRVLRSASLFHDDPAVHGEMPRQRTVRAA